MTHLSLRHDVEVVTIQGESHISQDRAAVLDDRYRLVLDAAMRRPVNTNLRNTDTQTGQWLLFIPVWQQEGENKWRVIDRYDRRGSNNICKTIYHCQVAAGRYRQEETLHLTVWICSVPMTSRHTFYISYLVSLLPIIIQSFFTNWYKKYKAHESSCIQRQFYAKISPTSIFQLRYLPYRLFVKMEVHWVESQTTESISKVYFWKSILFLKDDDWQM